MVPHSASLLAWALIDVRNRHLRLIGALGELRRLAGPGERAFLQASSELVESQLLEFDQIVDAFVHETPPSQLARNDPDAWAPHVRESIAAIALDGFKQFAFRQREIFPYLTVGLPPQDIAFFVARTLGMSPTRRSHQKSFIVASGRFTGWDSTQLSTGTLGQSVVALPIPFAEILTPLRWPLLTHEAAHWLRMGGEPLKEIAESELAQTFGTSTLGVSIQAPFDEIFADQVAYRSLGMGYAAALATEAYISNFESGLTYPSLVPSVVQRLELLGGQAAELLDVLPAEWKLDSGGDEVDAPTLERIAEVAQKIITHDLSQTPSDLRPSERNNEAVVKARELLRTRPRQPASAVQLNVGPTEEDFEAVFLDELSDEQRLEAKKRLLDAAFDYPCSDEEILEATWREELDRPPAELLDVLDSDLALAESLRSSEGNVDEAVGRLAQMDTSISRSLQAASVHRWLLAWDPSIRKRVLGT